MIQMVESTRFAVFDFKVARVSILATKNTESAAASNATRCRLIYHHCRPEVENFEHPKGRWRVKQVSTRTQRHPVRLVVQVRMPPGILAGNDRGPRSQVFLG